MHFVKKCQKIVKHAHPKFVPHSDSACVCKPINIQFIIEINK